MKKEIVETSEWLFELVKKFGFLVGIAVAIYFGLKKVWFWLVMPCMLLTTLKMLAGLYGWEWINKLTLWPLVVSWVFVFSVLSYLFVRDK